MLQKYTPTETGQFFVEAKKMKNTPPPAPKSHKFTARTSTTMQRWKARSVVRQLLPELNAKEQDYWDAVNKAEELLRNYK